MLLFALGVVKVARCAPKPSKAPRTERRNARPDRFSEVFVRFLQDEAKVSAALGMKFSIIAATISAAVLVVLSTVTLLLSHSVGWAASVALPLGAVSVALVSRQMLRRLRGRAERVDE